MFINRPLDLKRIQELLDIFPVVAILGSRQCGKTTLAKRIQAQHYFDLENPRDISRLENPQLALESLEGLIAIDEVQRAPGLFPLIRFLVDNHARQKYLILGSASHHLLRQSSESLAGRIGYHYLSGFRLEDVGVDKDRSLWIRGGYPRSFLAVDDAASRLWRENYIQTFLERDIPQLGIQIPSKTLYRFWVMLSHYHGSILNYAELGRSFGMNDMTIRRYVDILESTFMVRVLQPWHTNLKKRLVKRPKIYIRDSGLFHTLCSIEGEEQLQSHPKLGASWEGFALECVSNILSTVTQQVYFWGTHQGSEVDLVWQQGGKNWAVEFKYMDAPKQTKSMMIALHDLELSHLWIVYPGNQKYSLNEKITVLPLSDILNEQRFITK